MDKFELFAVKHHLDEWPDNKSFEDIINALNNGTLRNYSIAWPYDESDWYMPYEKCENVAESIIDMVQELKKVFK